MLYLILKASFATIIHIKFYAFLNKVTLKLIQLANAYGSYIY